MKVVIKQLEITTRMNIFLKNLLIYVKKQLSRKENINNDITFTQFYYYHFFMFFIF